MNPGKTCLVCDTLKPLESFHTYVSSSGSLVHHSYCDECNRTVSRDAARARRDTRLARGLCLYCDSPYVMGKQQCEEHLRLSRERTSAIRARKAVIQESVK